MCLYLNKAALENPALGDIPLFGALVVGRDGEGIFSLTYSVRGSIDEARVSINPLSAATPGILRRIFENPSDTNIPEELDSLSVEGSVEESAAPN